MLSHGAVVKEKNKCGWTPLDEAISYGDKNTGWSLSLPLYLRFNVPCITCQLHSGQHVRMSLYSKHIHKSWHRIAFFRVKELSDSPLVVCDTKCLVMVRCFCVVRLLLRKLREQTLQGLIQRRQKLISSLQNVSRIMPIIASECMCSKAIPLASVLCTSMCHHISNYTHGINGDFLPTTTLK